MASTTRRTWRSCCLVSPTLLLLASLFLITSITTAVTATTTPPPSNYRVGVGKGDITGPAGEVVMMGYGDPAQRTAGVLDRLRARAFIIEDAETHERVVLVSCDLQSVFQLVHQEVIARLHNQHDGVYTEQNVVLHATHTHSGPGGSSAYMIYDFCIFGFVDDNFNAIVSGILHAIDAAHASLAPGSVYYNKGTLANAGKNRSPVAYNANPATERLLYPQDVDTDLRLLQFRSANDSLLGLLAFFPVHPTSLSKRNRLISGDNKGYAEFVLEATYPGVIAGVGISNAGDVSPNLIDNRDTTFRGEGVDDIESAEIIGQRQADTVIELVEASTRYDSLRGTVRARLSYVNFANVTLHNTTALDVDAEPYANRTCPGLLGQNFGAGTEDGRALRGLVEGDVSPHAFYRTASHLVKPTPAWVQQCHHHTKVPLLATGLMTPTWTPEILPVQVVQIGHLALATTSFEVTTMAGRRLRATLRHALAAAGVVDVEIAALSNGYAQYVTTKEEYELQHYEGASTLFGPNQLRALQQELERVAASVRDVSIEFDTGPLPIQFDHATLYSFHLPVVLDTAGWRHAFGDVWVDAAPVYSIGSIVRVEFIGAHPRNRFVDVASFCDVEQDVHGAFETLLTDAHWDVRFHWTRIRLSESRSACEWHTNAVRSAVGRYRIVHRGFYKSITGVVTPFEGHSSSFFIVDGTSEVASSNNATASVC